MAPTQTVIPTDALIALSKLFSPDADDIKAARTIVVPGKRKVRGGVQFAGVLTVGQPYDRMASPRLSALHAMTLLVVDLVTRAGMSKQAALALVERVLDIALTKPASEDELEKSEDQLIIEIVRTKKQIQARIAERLPRDVLPGRTTWSGYAESRPPAPGFGTAYLEPELEET